MYKKLLYFLVAFWVFGNSLRAQEQSDHKGAVLNGGAVFKDTDKNLQMQFQIGSQFLYPMNPDVKIKSGFPFGVYYIPNTFSENTFEVSKGYYEDNIRISWSIGANEDNIQKFQVFRKRLGTEDPYQLIATLGATVFEYLDTQVEGGVLYEYKVTASGISTVEQKFVTYIDGIGFRNPTAFVSGSITFEGGSPVKDVTVFAEPIGTEVTSVGTSMQFKNYEEHIRLNNRFTNVSSQKLSIQGWFAPSINQANQSPVYFTDSNGTVYTFYFYYASDGDSGKRIIASFNEGSRVISTFELKNSYPTGKINAKGDDIFNNISSITDTTFLHLTLVLENNTSPKIYINGREINQNYIATINEVDEGVRIPLLENVMDSNYNNTANIDFVAIGSKYTGFIDEFRMWTRPLTDAEIRRDYKRYLEGGEADLAMYIRMDEGVGNFAYDISKKGFNFNKKDLIKSTIGSTNTIFSNIVPNRDQLGIFGITDEDGSYAISSIPYAGSGEQFKITPSFGVHKFKPASQTLFLGKEESVVNQVDFEDISSFKFNGRIVYDTRGVFNDIAITDPTLQDITEIREVGYNQYLINGTVTINKGQYYYEGGSVDSNTGNLTGGTLKRYPVIGLEDANIYIDGNLVFDEDNQPVVTDADGKFAINVPIGKHKVEVKKDGHVFSLTGRFPEKTSNTESNLFDFYEDQIEERWFIDETRVTVVGRVVGGRIENEKEIGFGFNGLKKHNNTVAQGDPENIEIYSSVNNIGKATIILKGDKNNNDLDFVFETNAETGEYKIKLLPYIYHIQQNGGIIIQSNTEISSEFLDSDETLDVTEIKEQTASTYIATDGKEYISEPYQYVKSFRYNSPVVVKLIAQEHEKNFDVSDANGNKINLNVSNLAVPLYKQTGTYRMVFEVTQDYINKDDNKNILVKEYYNEGNFNITNNLASPGSNTSSIQIIKQGLKEQYVYSFTAGIPNISKTDGFANSINVEYIIQNSNPISIANISEFKDKGIIIGAKQADGTTFSTVAPQAPDIVLRDPPGSNSFASIEKGTVISFESSNTKSNSSAHGGGYYVSVGPTITSETGIFFSVQTEVNIFADTEGNFSKRQETTSNGTAVETYQFNQTISTSDDPDYVGADGDLYIGNAKNVYYGLIDNMFVTNSVPKLPGGQIVPHIVVKAKNKDNQDVDVYISSRKDYFMAEQQTNTFFMYSQKHIIERLIPDLQNLANVAPEVITATTPKGTQTRSFYEKQIDLWKKVIQDNERDKYLALNNRSSLRANALAIINQKNSDKDARKNELEDVPFGLSAGYNFGELDSYVSGLSDLLNSNFESNKSFDSGVGEFTSSITTSTVISKTFEKTIDLTEEFKTQLGLLVNNVGAVANTASSHNSVNSASENSSKELTTTISYTLKDNDPENVLSVDVVNLFDGNGPIFITKGGTTSCPFEGPTISNYFSNTGYDATKIGTGGETLSISTINVFNPELTVDKTLITNLPESEGALFTLKLKNLSNTRTDLEHKLYVDPLTLNGAISNIDQNGINVFLPYNQTVEVPIIITKNSSSDVYNYENIRVYLANPCDGLNESDAFVDLNVEFKKSCSKVTVSAPQDNWVFNRNEAFSADANGNVTNKMLPITFTDFNTDFSGFRKIELQYKNANASSWTKLKTYYGSETLKQNAGDQDGLVIISESEFTFNWDIVGGKMADGNYQIRAIAFCTDDVVYESKIINGTINLTAPVLFGTPKPSDGILDIGEDISVRFNEAVNEGITTNITLRGLKNQQAIDHNVSILLDGSSKKIELPRQNLLSESFTIQFWLDSKTIGNGVLLSQENGPKISVENDKVIFELKDQKVESVFNNTQYNFYSFVYNSDTNPYLEIIQNGDVLKRVLLSKEISYSSSSSIFIGGTNILGNIHDVRIWSKSTTPGQAVADKDISLSGNELKLLGYWPLNEGHGTVAVDKVRNRNATVTFDWSIKPKGEGYEFKNNSYLTLTNVGFVQPTNFEDITLSFWIKANSSDLGTIFSNGLGTNTVEEPLLTNGFRNKWSLDLASGGILKLFTEGKEIVLNSETVANGKWNHIALVLRRSGSLNTYVNGLQVSNKSSEEIGGIAGSRILLGAKLNQPLLGNATASNYLTAKVDEFRLWNTARNFEQIKRDQYYELDRETVGLLLYVNFNEAEANLQDKGPRYNVRKGDGVVVSYLSELNGFPRGFTADSPSIKPSLNYTNIPFTSIINNDEMIISPDLTNEEWSLFEGQILDVSIAEMYDVHFNKQLSPISFSAFVNKQEIEWFTQAGTKEIIDEKIINQDYKFTMEIVNKGGNNQDFSISDLPTWMTVSANSGIVSPNNTKIVEFIVDKELAMGSYNADIYLQLKNGYSDRLQFNLRVLQQAPNWSVNPADYANSMSIISQIKIENVLSRDAYTKVGAFVNGEPRGEAYLVYDKIYDSYYAFLTIYSNQSSGEEVRFKIWDALNGKIRTATINDNVTTTFIQNEVLGTKSAPIIFNAQSFLEQKINLNKGWTWVSFFVEDDRFSNFDQLFKGVELSNGDLIKNATQFSRFENGFWSGSLTTLTNDNAYQIQLAKENSINLSGNEVIENELNININQGWNWLSFPVHRSVSIAEAFAFFEPTDGDLIKDQFSFAIYDGFANEWTGTLRYFQPNRGYMLKANKAQILNYPNNNFVSKSIVDNQPHTHEMIANFGSYQFNMSIIAEIVTDDEFDYVFVYDSNGKLRGKSEIMKSNDKFMSFITVFSDESETLKYVLVNKDKQLELTNSLQFVANKIEGTLSAPIQLGLNTLSDNEIIFEGISLYPNPFKNELHINIANTDIKTVEMYDAIGKSILKTTISNKVTTIPTNHLANGIYFIRLINFDGAYTIRKLIKE